MPDIDVVDSTWIGSSPGAVAAVVADEARWRRWWPDLHLRLDEDRGPKGLRWTVRSAGQDRFTGSMEIWIEPVYDGVVAHYFLRLDVTVGSLSPRAAQRFVDHYRTQTKRVMWGVADTIDPGRIGRVSAPPGR